MCSMLVILRADGKLNELWLFVEFSFTVSPAPGLSFLIPFHATPSKRTCIKFIFPLKFASSEETIFSAMDNSIEAALHYAREHVFLTICSALVLYSMVSRISSSWNRVTPFVT